MRVRFLKDNGLSLCIRSHQAKVESSRWCLGHVLTLLRGPMSFLKRQCLNGTHQDSGPLLGASWVVFTRTPDLFCWVRLENCRFQERPLRELPFLVGWFHPIETNSDSRAGKLASNHYSRNPEIQIFGGGFCFPILCTHCCEPNNKYLEGRMKSKIRLVSSILNHCRLWGGFWRGGPTLHKF